MTRRPKDIGTAAETAVVNYLRTVGFGTAERRALHGNLDLGDITGIPGVVIEVKAGKAAEQASDGLINAWLAETEQERRNAKADIGILVVKRKGKGSPADWWGITRDEYSYPVRMLFRHAAGRLRLEGYGDPLDGAA